MTACIVMKQIQTMYCATRYKIFWEINFTIFAVSILICEILIPRNFLIFIRLHLLRSIFFTTNEESIDINGSEEFQAALEGGSDSKGEDEESSSSEEEGDSSDDGSLQHVEMNLVQEVNAELLPKH